MILHSDTRTVWMANRMGRFGGTRLVGGVSGVALAVGIAAYLGWMRRDIEGTAQAAAVTQPHVMAASPEAAGRYLVIVGGCNDCHTPGFMEKGMEVPESEWLTGVPLGWRGPWGTTYASNLRSYVQDFDDNTFVQSMHIRNARPPMAWPSVNAMSDEDLRAVYRYIRSLPVKGEKMPAFVPPDQEPKTPYIPMVPQVPGGK
jgi:mono/diheme cytochrome c family protein